MSDFKMRLSTPTPPTPRPHPAPTHIAQGTKGSTTTLSISRVFALALHQEANKIRNRNVESHCKNERVNEPLDAVLLKINQQGLT